MVIRHVNKGFSSQHSLESIIDTDGKIWFRCRDLFGIAGTGTIKGVITLLLSYSHSHKFNKHWFVSEQGLEAFIQSCEFPDPSNFLVWVYLDIIYPIKRLHFYSSIGEK